MAMAMAEPTHEVVLVGGLYVPFVVLQGFEVG